MPGVLGNSFMNGEPIFVVGLSRSGKTMMCLLLATHPNIAMPHKESNLWTFFYRQYGDLSQRDNFERCLAAMLRYKGVQLLNPDLERVRQEFWQGEATYARLFALFHIHYAEQLGKPRWGVQSVFAERYSDLILAAYPTAKIIHLLRDPRDRYAAQIATRGSRRWAKVALATANGLYSASLARRYQERHPQRYKVVHYETLVSQPHETMREVCAFLGENYLPAETLQYKNQEISSAFMGRFRQVMSEREIAFMQACAKRDIVACNAELEPVCLSPRDYLLYYLVDQPVNLTFMLAWRIWKVIESRFPKTRKLLDPPPTLRPTAEQ